MEFLPRQGPKSEDPAIREAVSWAQNEFQRLARSLTEFGNVPFQVLHVAPVKPREGVVVFADGSDWNPGSGAGTYEYVGGIWRRLATRGFFGGTGGSVAIAAGQTRYMGVSGLLTAQEVETYFPVPFACTFRELNVVTTGSPGVGQTITFTLRKTLADTALAATVVAGSNVADATGGVSFASAERVAVKVVASAGAATLGVAFGLGYSVP